MEPERAYRLGQESVRVRVLHPLDAGRQGCEDDAVARGVPLPLFHRLAWAATQSRDTSLFVELRGREEDRVWAFAVRSRRTRALPGHHVHCIQRFTPPPDPLLLEAALRASKDLARDGHRVLRTEIELFSRDSELRNAFARRATAAGFTRRRNLSTYARTIAIELHLAEADLFAGLHPTARRHVRAVEKNPTALRCIEDPDLADRMGHLMRETLSRTGASHPPLDWAGLIGLAAQRPDLVRLTGLFRTDTEGPESLLSFACGLVHGDHVEYAYAASTRRTDLRMPLGYAPAWDLIRWAKRLGMSWFDFGGVTEGRHSDAEDPLGGISDFKRYFSRNVLKVGEEWIFEPSKLSGKVARLITATGSRFR